MGPTQMLLFSITRKKMLIKSVSNGNYGENKKVRSSNMEAVWIEKGLN